MHWRRWNWLDDGLLPLLLALLRFCWLWPWLDVGRNVLSPSFQGAVVAPLFLIGVPVLSLTLARLVASAQTDEAESRRPAQQTPGLPLLARLGVAVAGLLVILLVLWAQLYAPTLALWDLRWLRALGYSLIRIGGHELPVVVLMLLALIYLWLRGLLDAMKMLGHDDIWSTFVTGIVLLVLYLVTMALNHWAVPASAIELIFLFFGVGLAALALSSLKITTGLDRALGLGQRRRSKRLQINRYWLFSVSLIVVGLLGLGLVLSVLIAPEQVATLVRLLGGVLSTLWGWISAVIIAVSYILFIIAYFIAWLLQPLIRWLISLLGPQERRQPLQPQSPMTLPSSPAEAAATIPDAYRWIALAIFGLVVLIIFAVVLRRLWAASADDLDEERESILTADLLQDQLNKLWQKLFGGLRATGAFDPFLSLAGERDTRRAIRHVYQHLLAAATTLGQARPPAQTPRQYQQQLTDQLPETTALLTTLTERYNHARYAEDTPTAEAVAEVEQAWVQLQTMIEPADAATPPTQSPPPTST